MPNTKQPEQNKDWRESTHKILMSYIQTFAERPVLEIGVDFTGFDKVIKNLLKEQLERVNKEVIEKTRTIKWGNPVSDWSKGYNDGIEDVIKFVYKNEKRKA